MHPENLKARKLFGTRHRFKVCTGARYLSVYIGENNYKHDWIRERMAKWYNTINTFRTTTGKYSQESYDAVVRTVQSEWTFLQHVTWDMGDAFVGVEKIIRGNVLSCLLFGKKKIPLTHRRISKYNAGQESHIGTPESSDTSKR